MDGVAKDQIVKRDALGRVSTCRERREVLLDAAQPPQCEFERCGLKGAQFAWAVGVNDQTFAAWAANAVSLPPSLGLRHPEPMCQTCHA